MAVEKPKKIVFYDYNSLFLIIFILLQFSLSGFFYSLNVENKRQPARSASWLSGARSARIWLTCYVFSSLSFARNTAYSDRDLLFGLTPFSSHHFKNSDILIDTFCTFRLLSFNSENALFAFFLHSEYDSSTPVGSTFANKFHCSSSNQHSVNIVSSNSVTVVFHFSFKT